MTFHHNDRKSYGMTLDVVEKRSRINDNILDNTTIVEIGREIVFDPNILDTYLYDGWKPVHRDLLVVCAAVEYADRRCFRRNNQWERKFNLNIPVWDLEKWQLPEVQKHLRNTLRHLTGDDWHFSFTQSEGSAENEVRQPSLSFGNKKQFAIAYSDGLDSRCITGIFDKGDIAVRIRVSGKKDRFKPGDHPFDLIPFTVKVKPSTESSVRSRGFKFAAITAIAGHLSGVRKIYVPESGQGALGPVLAPLHNIYADYRNHPSFFRKMELFVEALLDYKPTYEQPHLWYTKGQTIATFLAQPGKSPADILHTRSCWQQRCNVRIQGKLRQCGLCAACLLRRMSMHAAQIDEPADTYTFADLTASHFEEAVPRNQRVRVSKTMAEYGSAGARHLQHLADLAERSNEAYQQDAFDIARHTNRSEQETCDLLRKLLMQHAEEWHDFIKAQGKLSFLHSWTEGARYGRPQ